MPDDQRCRLRACVETGAAFNEVVINRKKNGALFLNLLHLRGLVVARNTSTGEDIWVLLAAQMDITDMDRSKLPDDLSVQLESVARRIRKRIVKTLGELGLSGVILRLDCSDKGSKDPPVCSSTDSKSGPSSLSAAGGSWKLLCEAAWKPGEPSEYSVRGSLVYLPGTPAGLQALSKKLPELVALSQRVRQDTGEAPPEQMLSIPENDKSGQLAASNFSLAADVSGAATSFYRGRSFHIACGIAAAVGVGLFALVLPIVTGRVRGSGRGREAILS